MKLASFTLLRNEAPLLGPFLDQLDEFFDYSVLVDHESTDRSAELIAARGRPGWLRYTLTSSGYPQRELATHFLGHLFATTDADWLFFIDCDEFLPFATRGDLVDRLAELAGDGVELAELKWRNLLPEELDAADIFRGRFWSRPGLAEFGKVIVSRALFERSPDLVIEQGYHDASSPGSGVLPRAVLASLGLLHVPVPSRTRFVAKIVQGGRLMIENPQLFAANAGRHWANLYLDLEAVGVGGFDFERAALDYPLTTPPTSSERVELDFGFPYVRSTYHESADETLDQLVRTRSPGRRRTQLVDTAGAIVAFGVTDDVAPESQAPAITVEPSIYDAAVAPLFVTVNDGWLGEPGWLSGLAAVLAEVVRPRTVVYVGDRPTECVATLALAAERLDTASRIFVASLTNGDASAVELDQLRSLVTGQVTNVEIFDDGLAGVERLRPATIDLLVVDARDDASARFGWDHVTARLAPSAAVVVVGVGDADGPSGRLWDKGANVLAVRGDFPVGPGLGVGFRNAASAGTLAPLLGDSALGAVYRRIVADIGELRQRKEIPTMTPGDRKRLQTVEYLVNELALQYAATRGDLRASALDQSGLFERIAHLESLLAGRVGAAGS